MGSRRWLISGTWKTTQWVFFSCLYLILLLSCWGFVPSLQLDRLLPPILIGQYISNMALQTDIPNATTRLNLSCMPTEVLHLIFQDLSQLQLYALTILNRTLSATAATYLYRKPILRSYYRVAQFSTTIATCKSYTNMVRELEISDDITAPCQSGRATWLEWKYRTVPLYAPAPTNEDSSRHPLANRFLSERQRNLPLGIIIHVLAACPQLRYIFPTALSRSSPLRED